jgi:cytosine deaminase
MDPWYSLGAGDMLEVAHMGLHVAQMTSQQQMRSCFDAVTVNGAKVLGLADYGIEVGKPASFVLLQARDAIEAIRLRATRLAVVKGGVVLSRTAPQTAHLNLPGRAGTVDWIL